MFKLLDYCIIMFISFFKNNYEVPSVTMLVYL